MVTLSKERDELSTELKNVKQQSETMLRNAEKDIRNLNRKLEAERQQVSKLEARLVTPQELKHIQVVGGVNVHNDTMQFLAEQGVLGFGLMVLCAWTLVIPLLVAMFKRYRESRASRQPVPWPRWVYCHSPVCIVALVGPIATVVHSFADLPFRDPAVLLVWALSFVCALGYVPNPKGHHHHE